MSWFKDTMRKAHVLYVSPDWFPNRGRSFDAEKMTSRMKEAHVSSFELYAKDHHGFCYYDAHVGPSYPVDVLGEMVEKAHSKGMSVVAYFSVGYDNYAATRHPDWTCRDLDGKQVKTRELFTWLCFNSAYKQYMLDQLREIVRYEVDGLWLDIMGFFWIRFPAAYATVPYRLPMPTCYCPNCRAHFSRKHGRDLPEIHEASYVQKLNQFHREANLSFLQDVRIILKSKRPEALLSFNWAGIAYGPDVASLVDHLSAEAHPPEHLRQGFTCRFLRSLGKAYQMHTAGSLSGWSAWDTKPLNLLLLESSIALAHGGSPNIGLNPYPDGSWEEGQLNTLGRLFSYIEAREDYLRGMSSAGEIALLYGGTPPWPSGTGAVMDGFNPLIGFNELLVGDHYQFEFTNGLEGLSKYKVVIIPEQPWLSPAVVEKIRDYVKHGGSIMLTHCTSLFRREGELLPNFALADVMGVDYVGLSPGSGVYAALDKRVSEGLPEQPMVFASPAVETRAAGAQSLGTLILPFGEQTEDVRVLWGGLANPPGENTKTMALALNQFGRGRCAYIAVPLGTDMTAKGVAYGGIVRAWWKRLAVNMLRLLLPKSCLHTDAPPGVEVVVNQGGGNYVVHLMNHYVGSPDYLASGEDVPTFDVNLAIDLEKTGPIRKAYHIPDHVDPRIKHLEPKTSGRRLQVKVPGLRVHAMVILERG